MLTTFRAMRGAIAALAFVAVACGGNDPPGGGNGNDGADGGDMTDGTTGNGDTDGHVPNPNNPLIQAIPGLWEVVKQNEEPYPCTSDCDCTGTDCTTDADERCAIVPGSLSCSCAGCVTVDPTNPTCRVASAVGFENGVGPPGDACIMGIGVGFLAHLILEGDAVRLDPPDCTDSPDGPSDLHCRRVRGRVYDNGTRIEYTIDQWTVESMTTREHRRVR